MCVLSLFYLSLCFEHGGEFFYLVACCLVYVHHVFDLLYGVDDGGMVAVAYVGSDLDVLLACWLCVDCSARKSTA